MNLPDSSSTAGAMPAEKQLAKKIGAEAAKAMFEFLAEQHGELASGAGQKAVAELLQVHGAELPNVGVAVAPVKAEPVLSEKPSEATTRQQRAPSPPAATTTARREARNHFQGGGYFTMPNLMADKLLRVIPGHVLKAYVYCCRISDADAAFRIGYGRLAERIGYANRRDAQRVMRRLLDAGLVRQRWRGGPGRPNGYVLAGLSGLDFEKVRQALGRPLRDSGISALQEAE